jgi:hypothetical protein
VAVRIAKIISNIFRYLVELARPLDSPLANFGISTATSLAVRSWLARHVSRPSLFGSLPAVIPEVHLQPGELLCKA